MHLKLLILEFATINKLIKIFINHFRETRSHTPQVAYSELEPSSNDFYLSKDVQGKRYQTLPLGPSLKSPSIKRVNKAIKLNTL